MAAAAARELAGRSIGAMSDVVSVDPFLRERVSSPRRSRMRRPSLRPSARRRPRSRHGRRCRSPSVRGPARASPPRSRPTPAGSATCSCARSASAAPTRRVRSHGRRCRRATTPITRRPRSARPGPASAPADRPAGGGHPWNVPLVTPAWKWLPALVAGNAVLWKPSERATAIAVAAGELLHAAGIPGACCRCPGGPGRRAALAGDERVGALHFTGSEAAGRALAALAAPRFARVALELSGLNPAIVLADADLDLAADCIVACGTALAGQKCTATRRVIARARSPRRSPRLAERIAAIRVGDPRDPATDVGPLIGPDARAAAEAGVARAVAGRRAGARAGGARPRATRCSRRSCSAASPTAIRCASASCSHRCCRSTTSRRRHRPGRGQRGAVRPLRRRLRPRSGAARRGRGARPVGRARGQPARRRRRARGAVRRPGPVGQRPDRGRRVRLRAALTRLSRPSTAERGGRTRGRDVDGLRARGSTLIVQGRTTSTGVAGRSDGRRRCGRSTVARAASTFRPPRRHSGASAGVASWRGSGNGPAPPVAGDLAMLTGSGRRELGWRVGDELGAARRRPSPRLAPSAPPSESTGTHGGPVGLAAGTGAPSSRCSTSPACTVQCADRLRVAERPAPGRRRERRRGCPRGAAARTATPRARSHSAHSADSARQFA